MRGVPTPRSLSLRKSGAPENKAFAGTPLGTLNLIARLQVNNPKGLIPVFFQSGEQTTCLEDATTYNTRRIHLTHEVRLFLRKIGTPAAGRWGQEADDLSTARFSGADRLASCRPLPRVPEGKVSSLGRRLFLWIRKKYTIFAG